MSAPDSFDSPDGRTYSAPETARQAAYVELRSAALKLAEEFWIQAKLIEANPFGTGQLAAADIGRAIAYRDAAKQLRALPEGRDAERRTELGEDWDAPGREQDDDAREAGL